MKSTPSQPGWVEIRTVAGPSNAAQCALSGGPYTVWSHCRHVQVVCPPPPCPRQATCPTRTWLAPTTRFVSTVLVVDAQMWVAL